MWRYKISLEIKHYHIRESKVQVLTGPQVQLKEKKMTYIGITIVILLILIFLAMSELFCKTQDLQEKNTALCKEVAKLHIDNTWLIGSTIEPCNLPPLRSQVTFSEKAFQLSEDPDEYMVTIINRALEQAYDVLSRGPIMVKGQIIDITNYPKVSITYKKGGDKNIIDFMLYFQSYGKKKTNIKTGA